MYNNDSDSLNAGAPEIRLTGNQDPNTQMASMEAGQEGTLEDIYYELIGQGFSPREAAEKAKEIYNSMGDMSKAPQQNSGIMAAAPTGTYTQNRKNNMMAYGGIAGADGRKKYGIGSFFQKYVKDPLEVAFTGKSFADLERESQARVDRENELYGEGYQNPIDTFLKGAPQSDLVNQYLGTGNQYDLLNQFNVGEGLEKIFGFGKGTFLDKDINLSPYSTSRTMTRKGIPGAEERIIRNPDGSINKVIEARPEVPAQYEYDRTVNPLYPLAAGEAARRYVESQPKDTLPMDTTSMDPAAIAAAAQGTDAQGIAAGLRFLPEQVTRAAQGGRIGYAGAGPVEMSEEEKIFFLMKQGHSFDDARKMAREGTTNFPDKKAQGGRIGADEGGLMNLGGMEKDYRQEGGFVPIGGKEKADDVPARLSKNEFVFTADAVRNAGGGDIDKGAEIMENLMKSLESGGEVSEESQGLEGARGMFANAQQLQKRII